ncbi:MAG: GyrI-like domain-containing protein [Methanomassiliicoccales archaeon]
MPWDWKRDLKDLFMTPSDVVVEVKVPPLQYLTVQGQGDFLGSGVFRVSAEALLALSRIIRAKVRELDPSKDFRVGPLQAFLWNKKRDSIWPHARDDWAWKAMVMQPSFVDQACLEDAIAQVRKKISNPLVEEAVLETIEEGRSVQILYKGPYEKRKEKIEMLCKCIKDKGSLPSQGHHEIYLRYPGNASGKGTMTILRVAFQ